MPSRWEVALTGPLDTPVPLGAVQAVVSGWLDDPSQGHEAGSAARIRSAHVGPVRPWACGPLQVRSPGGLDETAPVAILQVRLLDDKLADRLAHAICPGSPVRLGKGEYQIAAPVHEVGRATWPDLRRWSGERAWQVRFVTPVCLRRGNRTSPLPTPESIARGLAERWQRLNPATAPPVSGPGTAQVWVSDIDGLSGAQILTRRAKHGGRWRFTDEVISGFTGRIRYVCDHGTDTDAANFGALMAFAAFAGAGSHTTYGFGVVCPEPTWQPPTLRVSRS